MEKMFSLLYSLDNGGSFAEFNLNATLNLKQPTS